MSAAAKGQTELPNPLFEISGEDPASGPRTCRSSQPEAAVHAGNQPSSPRHVSPFLFGCTIQRSDQVASDP